MSFEDINNDIKASGGDYVKLTKKEHGKLQGKILDVKKRAKQFGGKAVLNAKGEQRYEWMFSLEVPVGDGTFETKKWAASESAQWAIKGALNGRMLKPGGLLQVQVTEDSVQGQKQAEYKVIYTDPVQDSPFESDEPPF